MNHNRKRGPRRRTTWGTGYELGTVIQASDRQYVIEWNGEWRVLNYDRAPVIVAPAVDAMVKELQ